MEKEKRKKKYPVPSGSREICSVNKEQACALLYEKGVSRAKRMTQHRAERDEGGGRRAGNVSSSHRGERLRRGNLPSLLSHPQGDLMTPIT